MNILVCGDVMPGGVLPFQDNYISKDLMAYLKTFDFRICTLEAAIGDNIPFDTTKMNDRMNIIYARNQDLQKVKEMQFDVVSLANNHIFDLGEAGLLNTINQLDVLGIKHCGAGLNIAEASAPAIIEKDGEKIAILAYCMFGNKYLGYVELASKEKSGVNPLVIEKVIEDIKLAKSKYDFVIVMPHWGMEYQYLPLDESIGMAKKMVDAGADGVFSSHAHNIQPRIKYKNKPIYFGLGNFLFPDYFMFPPRPIWYPSPIESTNIPKEVGYPDKIEKPIISVWNGRSRIGMCSEVKLSGEKIYDHYHLTYLSEDNQIDHYYCFNNRIKHLRLLLMAKMIESKHYMVYKKIYESKYNLFRRGLHFISRAMRINYDVKLSIK